jgi:hypothetical protein
MTYWDGLWTGLLVGNVMGVVATVGAEVTVACLAYAGYRTLIKLGLLKVDPPSESRLITPEGR